MKVALFLSVLTLLAVCWGTEFTGKNWYHQRFGRANEAILLNNSIFVASEANVFAHIARGSGEVVWRRTINGEILSLSPLSNFDIILHSRENGIDHIMSWSKTGGLNWEKSFEEPIKTLSVSSESQEVLVSFAEHFRVYSNNGGEILNQEGFIGQGRSLRKPVSVVLRENLESIQFLNVKTKESGFVTKASKFIALKVKDSGLISHLVLLDEESYVTSVLNVETEKLQEFDEMVQASSICSECDVILFNDDEQQKVMQITADGTFIETGIEISAQDKIIPSRTSFAILRGNQDRVNVYTSLPEWKLNWSTENLTGSVIEEVFCLDGENVIIVFDDWKTVMYQKTHGLVWTREEALSSVVSAQVFAPSEQKHMRDMSFIGRLKDQAERIVSGQLLLSDFDFGIEQVLLVQTSVGKLFGLDSLSGDIIHSANIGKGFELLSGSEEGNTVATYIRQDMESNYAVVLVVDIQSGEISSSKFSFPDSTIPHQFIFAENHDVGLPNMGLGVLTMTTERQYALTLKENWESEKMIIISRQIGSEFVGLQVPKTCEGTCILKLIWTLPLPESSILEASERVPIHPQASRTQSLGDGGMLVKYLNPHLRVLGLVDSKSDELTMMIIDSITGDIIHSEIQSGVSGPIHVATADNWVVYSYENIKPRRSELGVINLFEGFIERKLIVPPKGLLESPLTDTYSSLQQQRNVNAVRQTYLPYGWIRGLRFSHSTHDITTRQLLVTLASGQVWGIPTQMIDPRRPVSEPTPAEIAEMLVPFKAELPLDHKTLVTQERVIEDISTIIASPTKLESTYLIYVLGLDSYAAPVQPSGGFDTLAPDFNKSMLILLTVALSVIVIVMREMSKRRELSKKWR
eukprot:TRINITY_DN348_c0_g1_i1.p1 TRINITY_DN348_c0_g1~~TRINITY_DN348_c0_g1_i1.p1  ORF type:complete len:862 (-),score=263.07 TRINITY_DN348_c0_g1_i1:214-2799(-)